MELVAVTGTWAWQCCACRSDRHGNRCAGSYRFDWSAGARSVRMIFYRLVTGRFASEAWSGSGANQYGGRWNHKGHPAVYVSTSISLASLEILVHVRKDTVLNQYQLFSID